MSTLMTHTAADRVVVALRAKLAADAAYANAPIPFLYLRAAEQQQRDVAEAKAAAGVCAAESALWTALDAYDREVSQ